MSYESARSLEWALGKRSNLFRIGLVLTAVLTLGVLGFSGRNEPVHAEAGEGITSGLTGWWKVNTGSGTSASDSSGLGHTGTLTNMTNANWVTDVPADNSSNNTNALSFNGSNQYVSVASPNLPTGDFTYMAWVKPTSWPVGKMSILSAGNSTTFTNTQEFDWYFTSAGNMALTLKGVPIATTSFAFPLNQWSHVAVTRSGSIITFYINGISAGGGLTGTALSFSTCPLVIGTGSTLGSACSGGFTSYWTGNLDDVRGYNRALSSRLPVQ